MGGNNVSLSSNSFFPWIDDVLTDNNNNTYISGEYRGNYMTFHDFNESIFANPVANTHYPDFLASFDEDGGLRWAKTIGAVSLFKKKPIAVDQENNLIVSGYLREKAGFDSLVIGSVFGNIYVAKFDENGIRQWVRQANVGLDADPGKVTIDEEGNIYVAGTFSKSTMTFGSIQFNTNHSEGIFLVKYDSHGNELWAKELNSVIEEGRDRLDVKELLVDNKGNIISVISKGDHGWSSSCNWSDWYVELESTSGDGQSLWQKQFMSDDITFAGSAQINELDEITLIGRYRGNFHMDEFSLFSHCEEIASFIAKLNSEGKVISLNSDEVHYTDIAIDGVDNYYLTGRETISEPEIIPGMNHDDLRSRTRKVFVKKYDKKDNILETRYLSNTYDSYPVITLDKNEKILLLDVFGSGLDTISNAMNDGIPKIYLMKFGMDTSSNYPTDDELSDDNIQISPNPTSDFIYISSIDEDFINSEIQLFSSSGQLISFDNMEFSFGYKVLDISHLPAGVYFVSIKNNDNYNVKKVIKQ